MNKLSIIMDKESFVIQASQFTAFALHNLVQQGQLKMKTIQIIEVIKETRRHAAKWYDQQLEQQGE